jgi:hypothetical protein
LLSDIYLRQGGKTTNAIVSLIQATLLNPYDEDAWEKLNNAYKLTGITNSTISGENAIPRLNSKNSIVYQHLIIAFQELCDFLLKNQRIKRAMKLRYQAFVQYGIDPDLISKTPPQHADIKRFTHQ